MTLLPYLPSSSVSEVYLPSSGNVSGVVSALPLAVYSNEAEFVTGCAEQVKWVYNNLGGQVLGIEITSENVYSSYQLATMEYSNIVNLFQAKNVLSNLLGSTTGTYDSQGRLISGSEVASGSNIQLRYPRWDPGYARRVASSISSEVGVGGNVDMYSSSFDIIPGQQDYDLQAIVVSQSLNDVNAPFYGKIDPSGTNTYIRIHQVFYKAAWTNWRFWGSYYGSGIVSLGNLSTYGQWTDDSTFEVVPVWQNKYQAIMWKDALNVRSSNYTYQLVNNKIRVTPVPSTYGPAKMWFRFMIPINVIEEDAPSSGSYGNRHGIMGVNNINTLPFEHIPYGNINSMGKLWIRKYSTSICKELLGNIRNKVSTIPYANSPVTLNGTQLIADAQREQKELKDELIKILEDTSYEKLMESEKNMIDNAVEVFKNYPTMIYVG